jgi:hypothetical protein
MMDDGSGARTAERRLRGADPARRADLPGPRDPAQSAVLRGILGAPREPTGGARRRRRARAAVGGLGLAALGALVALLMVATRGPAGSAPASVGPPPLVYSILSRPQAAGEASASPPPYFSDSGIVRSSVRVADPGPGGRYLLFRDGSGELCLFAEGPRGGGGGGCGLDPRRPPSVGVVGGQAVDDVQRLYALVPDGIVGASVDGHEVAVSDNVFHVDLPRTARSATVDFLTRGGIVTAWRQVVPLAIPRHPAGRKP